MNTASSINDGAGAGTLAGKYLTFILGQEAYGIPVLKVREIIRFTTPTGVPQVPDYVKGVINLRGKIIPVVDLRLKLGISVADISAHTCIIVVQVASATGDAKHMGMIVDGIEEVTQLTASEIEFAPSFATDLHTDHILGMAKVGNTVKTLLNIDTLLDTEAIRAKSAAAVIAKEFSHQPADRTKANVIKSI